MSDEISDAMTAGAILNLAKETAGRGESSGCSLFEALVDAFPNTPAAKEAEQLLRFDARMKAMRSLRATMAVM